MNNPETQKKRKPKGQSIMNSPEKQEKKKPKGQTIMNNLESQGTDKTESAINNEQLRITGNRENRISNQ